MTATVVRVSLHVREPSVVELTVGDSVQLDRLTPSRHGYVAERCDGLLPGMTTLALAPGYYFFHTPSEASLKVLRGGVRACVGTVDVPASRGKRPVAWTLAGDRWSADALAGDQAFSR